MARFRHLSHSMSSMSIYLLIDLLSNVCEFSSLQFPLGKCTVVNLCSVFNLLNTLLIVSFLKSVLLSLMDLHNPNKCHHCTKLCGTMYTWYVFLRMLTCFISSPSWLSIKSLCLPAVLTNFLHNLSLF